MQDVRFVDSWVKSVSLDEFLSHCAENTWYGISETDATGYWNRINHVIPPPNDMLGKDTGTTDGSGQPVSDSADGDSGKQRTANKRSN